MIRKKWFKTKNEKLNEILNHPVSKIAIVCTGTLGVIFASGKIAKLFASTVNDYKSLRDSLRK